MRGPRRRRRIRRSSSRSGRRSPPSSPPFSSHFRSSASARSRCCSRRRRSRCRRRPGRGGDQRRFRGRHLADDCRAPGVRSIGSVPSRRAVEACPRPVRASFASAASGRRGARFSTPRSLHLSRPENPFSPHLCPPRESRSCVRDSMPELGMLNTLLPELLVRSSGEHGRSASRYRGRAAARSRRSVVGRDRRAGTFSARERSCGLLLVQSDAAVCFGRSVVARGSGRAKWLRSIA